MKKRLFILFFFLCGSLCLIFAQVAPDVAISRLQEVTSSDYPEADVITIDNEVIHLDKDCKGTYHAESYKKILTENGRQQNELWFSYNTMYDTLVVNSIEIIKADGQTQVLNPKDFLKVQTNTFSKFANIYSDKSKLLTGTLPNIEIGDIIKTTAVTTVHNTRMEKNFFQSINVERYSPSLHQYLEINLPENLKFNIHHLNKKEGFVNYNQDLNDGIVSHKFNVKVAPQILYEPGMEDSDEFAYRIILTTLENWEQLSKWYYSIVAPHMEINDAMVAKTNELIADCKTREEKAKKLYYWVSKKVRYLGVDKETYKPGYEPHDVTYTFSTLGGVCRDKAALLVAMLRIAGIDADPILIASGYKLNPKAPVMWFNHAIAVSYDQEGNPELFYDPTDENTKELLPQYLEDCSYIIASEKGETLRTVPISTSDKNKTDINISVGIDNNYKAHCKVKYSYFGLADGFFRSQMMSMNDHKKREMIEAIVAKTHPLAELKTYTISDPLDTDKYMTIDVDFTIPEFMSDSDDILIMPLDAYKFSLSYLYKRQLRPFNMSSRRYPFKLPNTYSINIAEKIKLPYRVSSVTLPKVKNLDHKGLTFTSEANAGDKIISIRSSFAVDKIHFKQDDFMNLKEKIAKLASYEKLYLILEK
jgi:transglutaminase-like putative cysteine protease